MKKCRLCALFLSLTLLLTALPVSAAEPLLIAPAPQEKQESSWLIEPVKEAGDFPDVTGTWCETAVDTVCRTGLMQGKTERRFDAVSPLTNAQITVVTARLHHLLSGGDGVLPGAGEEQAWYQPAAEYLNDQCEDDQILYYLKHLNTAANDPCTRLSFVHMLSGILLEQLPVINHVSIVPDSEDSDVLVFYQAGILNGNDPYGTFYENESLTRGAAAAILARLVDPTQRLSFTLKSLDLCRDVLGVEPDTVLLTLNGEAVTAEVFAYACVHAGTLHWVADSPIDSFNTKAPLNYIKQLSASALVTETLIDHENTAESIFELDQAALAAKAAEKAGFAGISQMGWNWIIQHETIYNNMMIYYLTTYGEYGSRGEKNGYDRMSDALSAAKNQITLEAAPALETLDWSAIYHRAIQSPCVSNYRLSIW